MRAHITTALIVALLGMTVPAQLSAQRNAAQGRTSQGRTSQGRASQGGAPQGRAPQGAASQGRASQGNAYQGAASQGRAEAVRPAAPRQPVRREPAHGAPQVEPGRPHNAVPYVRNDNWYGHAAPADPRFRLARPFQHGRFGLVGPGHMYTVMRSDLAARRIWLPGGEFQIAAWDWPVTAPWCWTCDQFVVYLDPDHPGWYMLYDERMGEYVHAQFVGP